MLLRRDVAQFVESRVEAVADRAAVGEVDWGLVGDGVEDRGRATSAISSSRSGDVLQAGGGSGFELLLRRAGIAASERASASRSRGPAEPSVILASRRSRSRMELEDLAQFGAQDGRVEQFFDGVQARFDFGAIEGGRKQALAQQAAAHAGGGVVEDAGAESISLRFAGEQRLDSSRLRTVTASSTMSVGAVVEGRAIQVIERGALGVAEVVENSAGGADGERSVLPVRSRRARAGGSVRAACGRRSRARRPTARHP